MEDIVKQDVDDETPKLETAKKVNEQKTITSAMVDSWCKSIQEDAKLGAVRSILRAYRTACHYGDDTGDDKSAKFSVMSSAVFNKIMIFVLSEMDGVLRKLLRLPATGGMKGTIMELIHTRPWKNYNHLVKSYLGNSLHVLNQMTDTGMIAFTLRRLKHSAVFLAAFPSLLRKYIKVCGSKNIILFDVSLWSFLCSLFLFGFRLRFIFGERVVARSLWFRCCS